VRADVTVREDVEAMVKKTEDALGAVDILVNNGRTSTFPSRPFCSTSGKTLRRRYWVR